MTSSDLILLGILLFAGCLLWSITKDINNRM